jgi:flagellar hook-associated protein 2
MPIRVTGLNSGLDTDSIIQELMSAYNTKTEKYEKEQTKISWKQEIWEGLNTKVNSFYKSVGNLRLSSSYSMYKTTSSDSSKASVSTSGTAVTGTQKLHVLSTAQSGYLTGGKLKRTDDSDVTSDTKLSDLGFTGTSGKLRLTTKDESGEDVNTDIEISKDSTISDVVSQLKEAGVNASFDKNNGRIFLSSTTTGKNGDFQLKELDQDGNETSSENLLGALGLGTDGVKIDGSDAAIALNGVIYTSTSNNFTINGLTITTNAVTDDLSDQYDSLRDDEGKIDWTKVDAKNLDDSKAISISTTTDAQGIYDTVKDFLTNYNNIINEITELYNADSASDYEPLTDDEKDSMSDTEISKWETKIKDSLLRRDTSLNSLMSAMKNAMSQTITVDGKKYALSSFGIKTLTYGTAADNEENAYHIDGDEDDENTSGNTDKLLAAINENPQNVVDFMKQLASNLYTAIDNQMQSTTLRSRYCIYNDKELKTQYSNLTTTISDWEDKVSDKEDYYYEKFASMETALGTLQSQTSSLTGLLGS